MKGEIRMIILGIDPGLARMGFAVIEQKNKHSFVPLSYGCLETHKSQKEEDRLAELYQKLTKIFDQYKIERVAIEQLVFASNQTTAFEVSQARGLVYLLCGQRHIPIQSYSPTQIKLTIVGYGRAEKQQVQLMVKTIYNLKQIPKLDDTADALAVAYTGAVFITHI